MSKRWGIVFIDGAEIVFSVFTLESTNLILEKQVSRDLVTFSQLLVHPLALVEVLVDFIYSYPNQISWKIIARNLPEETIQIISQAINKPIEELHLAKEQQLICSGLAHQLAIQG